MAIPVAVLSGVVACQPVSPVAGGQAPGGGNPSTEEKVTAWIKHEGLADASPEEIATARSGELQFEDRKVIIPGSSLVVVFKMGVMQTVKDPEVSYRFTTTSRYELRDVRSGKTQAKIASTLSANSGSEMGYKQKVLFSPDGSHLLIYETRCDGSQNHDTYALVSKTPDKETWRVKYLKFPEFTGFEGVEEHGSTPVGFAGDDVLFKPVGSDRTCKKKLGEFEDAGPPVPFTLG